MVTLPDPDPRVIVWYDFICPFCYVAEQRTQIFKGAGLDVIELPFQSHPEFPVEGVAVGARTGPMYEFLAEEAAAAGLTLIWPGRIPNSRLALTAAEWVRRNEPGQFAPLHKSLFEAHFANGEDIGDPEVIDNHLDVLGVEPQAFWQAIEEGSAEEAIGEAEDFGRVSGVTGTPSWLIGRELVDGLRPVTEFQRLVLLRQHSAL